MRPDHPRGKSEDGNTPSGAGLKRRDILLGGTSLVAASTLLGAHAAQAQEPVRTPPTGKQPNILVIMGDDIGWENMGGYHQGIMSDKTPNLESWLLRACLHRLLRRSELYGRPRQFHHRRTAHPYGDDDRRATGLRWECRSKRHNRHRTERDGLRHRPVRQEPPWGPK